MKKKLKSYKEGGVASVDTPTPKGVSVGTQPYQDWEHRPVGAKYVPPAPKQIDYNKGKGFGETRTVYPYTKQEALALYNEKANAAQQYDESSWQDMTRNYVQNQPFPLNFIEYPAVAAANLSQPGRYFDGRQGYDAFLGAGEAAMDAAAIAMMKGSKSVPKAKVAQQPVRSSGFPMDVIRNTKGKTGAPTITEILELNKNQQILQGHGLDVNVKQVPISEIDWGKWNAEIPSNKSLLNEYHSIEQKAKAKGSWMKNSDGSPFQGSPEQFIQQNSQNFKKAFGNTKVRDPKGNIQITKHTTDKVFDEFDMSKFGTTTDEGFYGKGAYFHPNSNQYGLYGEHELHTYLNIENPISKENTPFFGRTGQDKHANSIEYHNNESLWKGEHDGVITDHVNYPYNDFNSTEYVTNIPSNIKSATGNNGMFDMTNPNIYKTLLPIAGSAAVMKNQNKYGGVIKNNEDGKYQKGGAMKKNLKNYKNGGYIGMDNTGQVLPLYNHGGYIGMNNTGSPLVFYGTSANHKVGHNNSAQNGYMANGGSVKQWELPSSVPGVTDYGDMYSYGNYGLFNKMQDPNVGWEGYGNPANLITNSVPTGYSPQVPHQQNPQLAMNPGDYSIDNIRQQYAGTGGSMNAWDCPVFEKGGTIPQYPWGGGYNPNGPDAETEVPIQTTPSTYDPTNTGVTPLPTGAGSVSANPMWRTNSDGSQMTDEQAQQNINDRPSTADYAAQFQPQSTNPWPLYGQAAGNLLGAGLMTASYFNDQKNQRNMKAYTRDMGRTDSVFAGQRMNTQGQKGDYTPNAGYFRPQSMTPTRAGNFLPTIGQNGGHMGMNNVGQVLPVYAYGGQTRIDTPNGPKYGLNRDWFQPAGPYGVDSKPDDYVVGRTLEEAEPGMGDIVIEKNEQVLADFNNDGTPALMQVNVGSHASGQDAEVEVPDSGAFVYSDTKKLKIKDKDTLKNFGMPEKKSGYTPAKIAKKYDLQRFVTIMQNPDSDHTSRKTAELMVGNYSGKLEQLKNVQEGMKQFHNIDQPSPMAKFGGNMYPTGGYTGPYSSTYYQQQQQMEDKPQAVMLANMLYGPPTSGQYNDGIPGVRTNFVENYNPDVYNIPHQNIDRLPITGAEGSPIPDTSYTPTPTNMQTVATGNNMASTDTAAKPKTGIPRAAFTSPDRYGMYLRTLEAATVPRDLVYRAPVTGVIPDTVFMDPTRAMSAISEQANAAGRNIQSGPGRAANLFALQGKAGAQSADVVGQYANQNAQIANTANNNAAAITNQILQMQGERANDLVRDTSNANLQYKKRQNEANSNLLNKYTEAWTNRQGYDDLNQTNQYFYRDPRTGLMHFRPGMDAAAYAKMTSGQGMSGSQWDMYKKTYDEAISKGVDEDDAKDGAMKAAWGTSRSNKTINKQGPLTTQNSIRTPGAAKQKYGGPVNSLKKFTNNMKDC